MRRKMERKPGSDMDDRKRMRQTRRVARQTIGARIAPTAIPSLFSLAASSMRELTGGAVRSMRAAQRTLIEVAGLYDDGLSRDSTVDALLEAIPFSLMRPFAVLGDDINLHYGEAFLADRPSVGADPKNPYIVLLHTYALWWKNYSRRTCSAAGCGRAAKLCCKRCRAFRFCGSDCIEADWSRNGRDGEIRSEHRSRCSRLAKIYDTRFDLGMIADPCTVFKELLRRYDAVDMPPPPFYGYLVHTDAPLPSVIAQLSAWKTCRCEWPSAAFFRSPLDERVRRVLLALMASRMCCRPEVALLLCAKDDGDPSTAHLPVVIHPCACHDHCHCMMSAYEACRCRSLRDDVLFFLANECELSSTRGLPPCTYGHPLTLRVDGGAGLELALSGSKPGPSSNPEPAIVKSGAHDIDHASVALGI